MAGPGVHPMGQSHFFLGDFLQLGTLRLGIWVLPSSFPLFSLHPRESEPGSLVGWRPQLHRPAERGPTARTLQWLQGAASTKLDGP